jgi:hypothetical protein
VGLQCWFRGGTRQRSWLIRVRRNFSWQCWSFAEAGLGDGLDLRRPADARALAEVLTNLDLSRLER